MSMELQVERLKDTIDQSDMDVPEFTTDDLVDVWLAGDEETFIKYWDMTTYGEEYDDVFLFRRNSDNADIIDSLLQEDTDKTYLALIGAFHFITEPGVQHYLEKKAILLKESIRCYKKDYLFIQSVPLVKDILKTDYTTPRR